MFLFSSSPIAPGGVWALGRSWPQLRVAGLGPDLWGVVRTQARLSVLGFPLLLLCCGLSVSDSCVIFPLWLHSSLGKGFACFPVTLTLNQIIYWCFSSCGNIGATVSLVTQLASVLDRVLTDTFSLRWMHRLLNNLSLRL